jgi:hypothetical protein
MKLGRTIVICLLFALAIAVYLYRARIDRDILAISPDEVSRGFSMEPGEQVIRIEIRNPAAGTALTLEKVRETWRIVSPVNSLAEQQAVSGLSVALRFASQQTRLRAEKDWAEYGLEKPGMEVRVVTDKTHESTLNFGAASPIGKAVYARWAKERGYILVTPELKSAFDVSLYTLRDKSVFRTPMAEARKVFVEMGPNAYEWKKDQGKWYWIEPVSNFGREMPPDRMELVFRGLDGLNVKKFLDRGDRSDAEFGFYVIHDRIRVEGDPDAAGGGEVFNFGNEVPLENAYYGKMESTGDVILIDRVRVIKFLDLMKALEKDEAARREKSREQK